MPHCMMSQVTGKRIVRCTAIVFTSFVFAQAASAQWPQWGGKNRDFVADAKDLATVWPESGPKKTWSRALGPGYASMAFDADRLYTIHLEPSPQGAGSDMGPAAGDPVEHEIVVALDAESGETVWQHKYAAPWPKSIDRENLKGPNATPIVHNGRVYTFGLTGKVHCLDQKSGKPIWSHDVVGEFGATMPGYGFASSPLIYKNKLILPVGGPGVGVMAFDSDTGRVLWKKHDFAGMYSSPIVVRFDGADEIVLLAESEVVGMEPASGEIEWRYPFKSNIMTPLWSDNGQLFVGSQEFGSRALKLTRKDGKVDVKEIWSQKEMRVEYTNAVRVGELIIGCGGWDEKYFLTAVDAETGKMPGSNPISTWPTSSMSTGS